MDSSNIDCQLVQSILQSCPVCFLIQEKGIVTYSTPYSQSFLGIPDGSRFADYIADSEGENNIIPTKSIEDFQNWDRIDIKSGFGDIRHMEIKSYEVQSGSKNLTLTWLQDIGRLERAENTLKFLRNDISERVRIARDRSTQASYEMRKGLNSILGLATLLGGDGKPEYLEQLRQSATELISTMDEFIHSEDKMTDKERFALKDVLSRLEKAIRRLLDKRGLEYRVLYQDDIPVLLGYPKHIQDVLVLLSKNAIGFTREGVISVNVTEYDRDEDSITLLFSVQDTGCGMPKEQVEALFPQFAVEDDSLTERYRNGGLGLTTVQALVDSMGGRMWCKSAQGVGTTVYFTARCERVKPNGEAEDLPTYIAKDDAAARGIRVLIVDDDRLNRMVACELLKRKGYVVVTAESGIEAVDILKADGNFHLVLMDVYMPDMDGPTATKIIRGMYPELPIVALTACAMPGDREMCLALGMNDYFTKPFEASGFLSLVSRWTSR